MSENQKQEQEQEQQKTQADLIAERVNEARQVHEFWKEKHASQLGFIDWVRVQLVIDLGRKAFSK